MCQRRLANIYDISYLMSFGGTRIIYCAGCFVLHDFYSDGKLNGKNILSNCIANGYFAN